MAVIDYRADAGRQAALAALRAELYETEPDSLPWSGNDAERAICGDRRHFAVFAADRMLGHVTAFVNRDLQDRDGTPVGALGDFECVDDASVASEFLGAAIHWLRTTGGRNRIWGPINFDIWNGYRFMTEGFDTCRFHGEPGTDHTIQLSSSGAGSRSASAGQRSKSTGRRCSVACWMAPRTVTGS